MLNICVCVYVDGERRERKRDREREVKCYDDKRESRERKRERERVTFFRKNYFLYHPIESYINGHEFIIFNEL